MVSTKFFDINGSEIMSDSLVTYSDIVHGIENEEGYTIQNLIGVWEIRNIDEQSGNSIVNVSNIQIIGTRK